MANPKDINALFELEGQSLTAAKALLAATAKAASERKPQSNGLVSEIQSSWASFYYTLHENLQADHPDVLKDTGLLSPATVVSKGHDTLPRAYIEYPMIFLSPEENPRFFMYCPIDYKGQHFTPTDGRLIKGKEESHIGNLLFAGGHLGNAPIFHIEKRGTSTPVDYKSPRRSRAKDEFERVRLQNTHACFIAGGRSLQIVNEIANFDQNFTRRCDKVIRLIKAAARKQFPELLKSLPAGETLYINSSYGYGGHHGRGVEFDISIRQSGKIDLMAGGRKLNLLESRYFNATPKNGEYTITPRTDTEEGKKIAAAFKEVPEKSFIQDYPELQADFTPVSDQIGKMLGTDQPFPRVHRLEGLPFLVYGAKVKEKITFCPPGALPVSTALYEWLKSDEGDRNMGITPPPPPPAITNELTRLRQRLATPQSANKDKSPGPKQP
ncbi:MAG: hypothetical protein HYS17_09170 [Micavibrio aeruginosavorus]|uniref:Uncharacterized protein n=1 Tax=Micavibrio aeruginosavorus TaxID=349221 RepID=A0A7T5R1G4_9BACT|nr:MAG: hypothetical protein HYS17_09170 [Micavibrio aeruginosavorus]